MRFWNADTSTVSVQVTLIKLIYTVFLKYLSVFICTIRVTCPEREAVEGSVFYPWNDSNVFFIPSSALTGIFSIPNAFFIFWLETTYDSVNFLNRSLFKGKWKISPVLANRLIIFLEIFQIFDFRFCAAAIKRINSFVEIASSSATW